MTGAHVALAGELSFGVSRRASKQRPNRAARPPAITRQHAAWFEIRWRVGRGWSERAARAERGRARAWLGSHAPGV